MFTFVTSLKYIQVTFSSCRLTQNCHSDIIMDFQKHKNMDKIWDKK